MKKKNYIDSEGNYHNVENLTLKQIFDEGYEDGYSDGLKDGIISMKEDGGVE